MKEDRLEDQCFVLNRIGEIAEERGVIKSGGYVVNGGDTFDIRGKIPTRCFDALVNERKKWHKKGIKHIDNIGNHDQEDRVGKIHPMRVFEEFGWRVANEPLYLKDMDWWVFPYSHDLKRQIKDVSGKHKVAILHAGVAGAKFGSGMTDEDGITVKELNKFEKVFTGHYHLTQNIGHVWYIGDPLQLNFGERGQDKGVILWDDNKDRLEFCEIKGTPKFYHFKVDSENKVKDLASEKDFVSFEIDGDTDFVTKMTKDKLGGMTKGRVSKVVRNIVGKRVSRLNIKSENDTEIFEKYINFLETNLDKKVLLEMGLSFQSDDIPF